MVLCLRELVVFLCRVAFRLATFVFGDLHSVVRAFHGTALGPSGHIADWRRAPLAAVRRGTWEFYNPIGMKTRETAERRKKILRRRLFVIGVPLFFFYYFFHNTIWSLIISPVATWTLNWLYGCHALVAETKQRADALEYQIQWRNDHVPDPDQWGTFQCRLFTDYPHPIYQTAIVAQIQPRMFRWLLDPHLDNSKESTKRHLRSRASVSVDVHPCCGDVPESTVYATMLLPLDVAFSYYSPDAGFTTEQTARLLIDDIGACIYFVLHASAPNSDLCRHDAIVTACETWRQQQRSEL